MISQGSVTKNINSILDSLSSVVQPHAKGQFASWVKNSNISAPSSSNMPSQRLPFQRWYRFKEAFSPLLVLEAIQSLGYWPENCLDCFGGSGTTALSCQFLGIRPTTIEVNPFLADLIEAKLTTYDREQLKEDFLSVIKNSGEQVNLNSLINEHWPSTMMAPGKDFRWLYSLETFKQIIAFRDAISNIDNSQNQRLLRVLLGSILIEMSNVVISGKARRYRKNWLSSQKNPKDVVDAFNVAFNEALFDIANYSQKLCPDFELLRGDARNKVTEVGKIDIALFSPPYPNSFDYTDIYNIELWVLGYLNTKKDNQSLRNSTLRSHVQISRDMSWEGLDSPILKKTVEQLKDKKMELWNQHLPNMIGAYFFDLHTILKGMRDKIDSRGAVVMTVGDSRYAGVLVDVGEILSELALSAGYKCEAILPVRSMKSSAQQGWSMSLSEEIVRFRPI